MAEPGEFPFYRTLDVGAQGPDVRQARADPRGCGVQPRASRRALHRADTLRSRAMASRARLPGSERAKSAKTVTVSLQPNGNGYTVGPQNTAAVTMGPDLGTPPRVPSVEPDPSRRRPVAPRACRSDRSAARRRRASPPSSSSRPTAISTRTSPTRWRLAGTRPPMTSSRPPARSRFPPGFGRCR